MLHFKDVPLPLLPLRNQSVRTSPCQHDREKDHDLLHIPAQHQEMEEQGQLIAYILIPRLPPCMRKSEYAPVKQRPWIRQFSTATKAKVRARDNSDSKKLVHVPQVAFESNWPGAVDIGPSGTKSKQTSKEIVIGGTMTTTKREKKKSSRAPGPSTGALAGAFTHNSANPNMAASALAPAATSSKQRSLACVAAWKDTVCPADLPIQNIMHRASTPSAMMLKSIRPRPVHAAPATAVINSHPPDVNSPDGLPLIILPEPCTHGDVIPRASNHPHALPDPPGSGALRKAKVQPMLRSACMVSYLPAVKTTLVSDTGTCATTNSSTATATDLQDASLDFPMDLDISTGSASKLTAACDPRMTDEDEADEDVVGMFEITNDDNFIPPSGLGKGKGRAVVVDSVVGSPESVAAAASSMMRRKSWRKAFADVVRHNNDSGGDSDDGESDEDSPIPYALSGCPSQETHAGIVVFGNALDGLIKAPTDEQYRDFVYNLCIEKRASLHGNKARIPPDSQAVISPAAAAAAATSSICRSSSNCKDLVRPAGAAEKDEGEGEVGGNGAAGTSGAVVCRRRSASLTPLNGEGDEDGNLDEGGNGANADADTDYGIWRGEYVIPVQPAQAEVVAMITPEEVGRAIGAAA
ncbi:hypothetical protein EDB87DRAFT_1824419 [Lactarius vividus]|nr:hypothetical protein EDB87DRAFT_1824419 [Lactarius vividus]